MPINIQPSDFDNVNNRTMVQALTGGVLAYTVPNFGINKAGTAQGELVGGNLSILYSLLGSSSDVDTAGKILFIEDLDEHLYHVDRMMQALKRAGKLSHLAGLVVGTMSDMHNNDPSNPFGQEAEEIVAACCQEYSYPICYQFPVGHAGSNVALKLGARVTMSVMGSGGTLIFNE